MVVSGLQTLGSELMNPDFALLAQACGGIGRKASNAQEVRQQLAEAFKDRKPTIIDVQVEASLVPHTRI